MKHVFENSNSGSLTVSERNSRFYFDFEDIMRGMTLIDEEDTLKRLGKDAVVSLMVGKNTRRKFLRESELYSALTLTRNPKANAFKHWMFSTVLPDLKKKTLVPDSVSDPEPKAEVPAPVQVVAVQKNPLREFLSEQFGKLRVVEVEGEPWFVGKDVAEILGYSNTRKALADHVDEEDKNDGVTIRDSIGRDQTPIIINESGLYSLIVSSKLPAAKQFKRWVTHEILPSIRKHGGYLSGQENMTPEQLLAQSLIYANSVIEEYKRRTEQLQTYINDNAGHTTLGRMIEGSSQSLTVGQFAKMIYGEESDAGRNRMFKRLADLGLIFRDGRYWFPYQNHLDDGWFEVTYKDIPGGDGIVPVVLIKPKGQVAISKKLKAA